MSIELLIEVMAPPSNPSESSSDEAWSSIETAIGTQLPEDYKQYINIYGTGLISDFLIIFNPFSSNKNINLTNQIYITLDALRAIKEEFGEEECPYPLYPELGGLLPWGVTDNGDILFWLTSGTPNTWTVILNRSRWPTYEHFNETITSFLTKLLSGDISSPDRWTGFFKEKAFFRQLDGNRIL